MATNATVVAYLKHYREKRKSLLEELSGQFNDLRDMRLLHGMYTRDELEGIIDGLKEVAKANADASLEQYSMEAIDIIKDLYLQAEGHNLTLETSVHSVEAYDKLEEIANINLDPLPDNRFKAPAIASVAGGEAAIQMRINDADETIKRLSTRRGGLAKQLDKTTEESACLREELETLRAQKDEVQEGSADRGTRLAYSSDKAKQNAELEALQKEISKSKEELNKKVVESKQFQQFKKMVSQKNTTLRDVRDQVAELEGGSK